MKENRTLVNRKNHNKISKNATIWGIGIEHEMRVRFEKGYYQFTKEFVKSFFPNQMGKLLEKTSGYIFVNSIILLYYFYESEVFEMKRYFEYAKTDKEKQYSNEILILYDLYNKAKSKVLYPLDNPLYFKRSNEKKDFEKNLKRIKFYLKIYSLYHNPLLFYNINYKEDSTKNITFDDFWNYEYQLENIENDYIFDDFMKNFESYYKGDIYRAWKEKLNNILQSNFVRSIVMDLEYENKKVQNVLNLSESYSSDSEEKQISYQNIRELEERYINVYKNMIENTNNKYIFNNKEEEKQHFNSLYLLYKNEIPLLDHSSESLQIEFTTVSYKNHSFEFMMNEIINMEKTFFKVVGNIPVFKKYTKIFGDLTFHNIGSLPDSIELNDIVTFEYYLINKDYSGSYHIWITPPYHPRTTPQRFSMECATLANKFQLIEPLIAAHFTSPSIEAFGDNREIPRSSLRQFIGNYSNYGTSDISFLMGASSHLISKFFLSEEDLKDYIENGNNKSIFNIIETPIHLMNGKPFLNYNKLEERRLTSQLYKDYTVGNINSKPPTNIEDYYSKVFTKSKIRPPSNNFILGPDIRTKEYEELVYPCDDNWKKEYIKKGNKFYVVWVNYNEKKISYENVYDKNEYNKRIQNERIGIEFRVFDHFNTENLEQILRILACLTYQSASHPYKVDNHNMYIHKQWWHDEMSRVIMEGFEYKPSLIYLRHLSKEFDISAIRLRTDLSKHTISSKTYTQIVFEKIYEKMNEKFKNSSLYQKLRFKKKVIPFQSMNKKAWYNIFTFYLLKNPNLYRNLTIRNHIEDLNIIKVLGDKYKYNIKRVKKYLTNIKTIKNRKIRSNESNNNNK